MAATKTLNTRIQLKYDTYENWTKNNPTLLKGELAVVEVPTAQGNITQVPAVLIKVGDGAKAFNDLPWGSAQAADVYAWAKTPTKPQYQANEIQGLDAYISGKIEDTNTQYQLVRVSNTSFKIQSKEKGQSAWTDGATINITYTLTEGTEDGTVSFNGTNVKVHGLGSAAFTEADMYEIAGAANTVKSEVVGTASDASTKITIYGARKYAEEKANEAKTGAVADAKRYTDTTVNAAKTELIGTGDATSTTIKGAVGEAKSYTDEQINAKVGAVYKPQGSINFADLPKPVTKDQLGFVYNVNDAFSADERFINVEVGKKYPAGTNVAVITQEGKYYLDALTGSVDLTGYATQEWVSGQINTAKSDLIGTGAGVASTTIKGAVTESKQYADSLNTAMGKRVDGLETKVGNTSVQQQITTAIGKLDKTDSAVASQFVTAVSETDGIISVTRKQPEIADVKGLQGALDGKVSNSSLAAIAKTGNVNDLQQTGGDYIVFNCGSSSEVI